MLCISPDHLCHSYWDLCKHHPNNRKCSPVMYKGLRSIGKFKERLSKDQCLKEKTQRLKVTQADSVALFRSLSTRRSDRIAPLFSVCDLARYLKRHGVKYMTAVQLFVTQGQISVVHNHIFNVRRPAVQNFLSHDIFICYCYSISLKKQQPFPILPLKQKGGSPGRYVLTTYVLTHSPSSDISRVIWKLLILKYF